MTPLESRLRQLVAPLDEAALEALASKGLLRRARKDLERGGEIRIEDQAADALRIRLNEHCVILPEAGPAKATCSCPASGVCQHILAAVLFLQQQSPGGMADVPAPTANPADVAKEEWLRFTPEQLEQWAGKAAFRAALKLASETPAEIAGDRGLRIRFNSINAECHAVPGTGLDGIIVSGGKDPRVLAVAAVISVQRASGIPWIGAGEPSALEESSGAPRSRAEVLQSCQRLLDETLTNGLSRLSSASQQRWATLAVSALGVNLPRLALALRGISDEATLLLTRDARADSGRMLSRMAQVHALCAALEKGGNAPRADLVGTHRTHYAEVGNLDLTGIAAWPWRTASGYEGITVLFWDAAARHWCSWSESRPRHQLGEFSAVARYGAAGPWEGAESPRQLARSSFRLMNARRNAAFRLSGSSRSRALVTGPSEPALPDLPVFTDWKQLEAHLDTHQQIGLAEANPLTSVVALRPAAWGYRAFDSVRQIFVWAIADQEDRVLLIEVAFDDLNEPAIRALENLPADLMRDAVVIGRIARSKGGLTLFPFSVIQPATGITCLALDAAVSPRMMAMAVDPQEKDEPEWESPEPDDSRTPSVNPLLRLLDELDDGMLALAEGGLANPNVTRDEKLKGHAARTQRLHLDVLSGVVGQLIQAPDPATLLRATYVSQLYRRAEAHSV